MISRVFCYSKEEAKKNGNNLPILQLVLLMLLLLAAMLIFAFFNVPDFVSFISVFLIFLAIMYYGCLLSLRQISRLSGYAIDNQGKIYKVTSLNNGQGLYFAGSAAGGMVDQLTKNASNLGQSFGGVVGAIAEFKAINKSANYMSNPEIIEKMITDSQNVTGAYVVEIVNVHSTIEKKHSLKVKCDFRDLRSNKVFYNRTIYVRKSYICYKDLFNALNLYNK